MKRLAFGLSVLMSPAFAHPGDHAETGLFHFLTEPDHLALLALAAVVGIIAVVRYRSRR
jgi:hydrogenase/urease accessory protein HupE